MKNEQFFDTLKIRAKLPVEQIKQRAGEKRINLRYFDDGDVRERDVLSTIADAPINVGRCFIGRNSE